jgi:hypothetical protein
MALLRQCIFPPRASGKSSSGSALKNAGSWACDSCLGEGVRGSVHELGRSRRGVQVSSCPGQQHAKSPRPQPVGLEATADATGHSATQRLRQAAAEAPGAHLLGC